MEELQLRRERVQQKINRYLEAVGDYDDERLDLLLDTAILKRDIIDLQMTLIDATNEEERRGLRGQIQTKEQQILTKEQLLLQQPQSSGKSILIFRL
jgi:hypothetical protein